MTQTMNLSLEKNTKWIDYFSSGKIGTYHCLNVVTKSATN